MKKELEISRLMDSYSDEEFMTEEVGELNAEKICERVMSAAGKPKKRLKTGIKLMIAAAAVVGASLITAASVPETTFISLTGQRVTESWLMYGSGLKATEEVVPYTVEGDRIYFTADGGHTDITDLISDEDAYFYEYTKTDNRGNERRCCIAVGGTVRNPSYGEIIMGLKPGETSARWNGVIYYYRIDGRVVSVNDMTDEEFQNIDNYETAGFVESPWTKKLEYKEFEYRSQATGEDINVLIERRYGKSTQETEEVFAEDTTQIGTFDIAGAVDKIGK